MTCVITQNELTQNEDFAEAAIVLTSLGDPAGAPCVVVQNRSKAEPGGFFTVDDLEAVRMEAQ
jgi:hypothetical protein